MRRQSKKRASAARKSKPLRADYLKRVWLCECCCKRESTQVHEIVGGSNRWITEHERCFWLAVCWFCNTQKLTANGEGEYPLVRQLKLKLLADPEYFDLARVLEVAGFAPTYITIEEVRECAA